MANNIPINPIKPSKASQFDSPLMALLQVEDLSSNKNFTLITMYNKRYLQKLGEVIGSVNQVINGGLLGDNITEERDYDTFETPGVSVKGSREDHGHGNPPLTKTYPPDTLIPPGINVPPILLPPGTIIPPPGIITPHDGTIPPGLNPGITIVPPGSTIPPGLRTPPPVVVPPSDVVIPPDTLVPDDAIDKLILNNPVYRLTVDTILDKIILRPIIYHDDVLDKLIIES